MTQRDRQLARRRQAERLVEKRIEFVAREQRIREQARIVSAAVLERDRVIAQAESRISDAINQLTVIDAVPVREAATLCGLEPRDVTRFRRARAQKQIIEAPDD